MDISLASQKLRGCPCAGSVLAGLIATLLAACGGGGGGSTDVPVTPPPVVIDTAQLSAVAVESAAGPVLSYAADIDDIGRVAVVYLQSDGARNVLMASQSTPGALGTPATFSAATAIDGLVPNDGSGKFSVATSPAGNVVAVWTVAAPCSASTYYTSGTCNYSVAARRMAGGNWESPTLVGDSPALLTGAIINDAGDILVALPGWMRDGSGNLSIVTSVAWKANASAGFNRQLFPDITLASDGLVSVSLDRSGNMALVAASVGTSSTDIVAVRGTLQSAFGYSEVLNTLPVRASLEGMWGGVNGQLVVLWQQPVNGQAVRWSATADGPGQVWAVTERGAASARTLAGRFKAAVGDNGDFVAYDLENCQALHRKSGSWQAATPLNSALCPASASFISAVSRAGNLIGAMADPQATGGNTGKWISYNAAQNALVQTFTTLSNGNGYLFGAPSAAGGLMLLGENGVASFVTSNAFETLPTAAAPAGVLGSSVNLWAVTLKPN